MAMVLKGVWGEEHGSFYVAYENGREVKRKKIDSNGTAFISRKN